jgi:serine/threonine-protein kinase
VIDATGNYDRALQQCHDELAHRSGPEAPGIAEVSAQIDPAVVAKAKQQLAKVLGPIAGRIVERAVARAKSTTDLYGILGHHIDDPSERARFLAVASAPPAEPAQSHSIDAASIEALTRLMARYIGPIAAIVVKRESQSSEGEERLRQRLPDRIPDERQRAEFLREARRP